MTPSLLSQPRAFERGDKLYMVTPLAPVGPADSEIEEYAFSKELLSYAPNDNLMWLKGAYAEADRPNANGQMWLSGELALKHLTPRLMPVTVMHDPRTAVGMIADTKLLLPEASDVPRARIETTLGIWKHRFPEVAEEALHNYQEGTLMQSMECIAPNYSCQECGKTYPKLPGGAEEEFWCEHLTGVGGQERAGRILGNVTFTGTGLIFGTRGSRGAYDEAHLDMFQAEIAEFHSEATRTDCKRKPRSKTSMDTIEISKSEYAELQKRVPADDLAAAEKRAEEAETAKAEAEKALEAAQVAQKSAEEAKAAAEEKVKSAEEAKAAEELRAERMSALGKGFLAKLPEAIRTKLGEQARDMSEEDWTARLEELSSLTGVKSDEGVSEGEQSEEFTSEEIASAGVGSESGVKGASPQERSVVFGSLLKS